MFSKIFRRKLSPIFDPQTPSVPEGLRAYVIGDVHGCYAQMLDLLSKIKQDALNNPNDRAVIVFLGDLIDRGAHSKHVIEFLLNFKPDFAETLFLTGNHEYIFLKVLEGDISSLMSWFEFGGRETSRSYGVKGLGELHVNPDQVLARIQKAVPQSHIDFLKSFKDYHIIGDYICVHAGFRPKVTLDKQSRRDMYWIRQSFLESTDFFEYKVIHGHSVVDAPDIHPNRIAVDTGAYRGGPLTAACLHADSVSFIQA